MPSTSPGQSTLLPSRFIQILPGAPSHTLQSVTHFSFRHKHYVAYAAGRQLNILAGPYTLVQCVPFEERLVAVAAEKGSGRLAVAAEKEAWIFTPVTEGWNTVHWEQSLSLQWDNSTDEACFLSWGIEDEILLGGSAQLSLFSALPASRADAALVHSPDAAREMRRPLWSIQLPSPVQYAAFNPGGTLIATCGVHDRLVKIWRRLSFEEGLFDYMYIPHPCAVTSLQWRPSLEYLETGELIDDDTAPKKAHDDPELLYTVATDGILRVWRTGTVHDLDMLSLYAAIDLVSTVPDSPTLTFKDASLPSLFPSGRFVCLLPAEQFSTAVKTFIGVQDVKRDKHSTEHFREVVSKDPDVIISFDGRGRMSAWGLQSVGHKRRPESPPDAPTSAFHIAHTEGLPIRVPEEVNANFEAWLDGGTLNLVAHFFNGEIRWWRGDSTALFSPATSKKTHLPEVAYWSGHSGGPINALAAASDHRSLLLTSAKDEFVLLESTDLDVFQWPTTFQGPARVIDTVLVTAGPSLVLSLQQKDHDAVADIELVLRNVCSGDLKKTSLLVGRGARRQNLRLFVSDARDRLRQRAIVLSGDGHGLSCIIDLETFSLDSPATFTLAPPDAEDPIIHSTAVIGSQDLDRVGVIALTKSGCIVLYHLETATNETLEAALIAVFHSGVTAAGILASTNDFAFVVSPGGSEMVIVSLTDGYVEFHVCNQRNIKQVVPSSSTGLVAIGNDSTIDIFAQGRIGYREEMPPWVQIKRVSLAGLSMAINAVVWLYDGSLGVAAGSCVFITSSDVDIDELNRDVREATGVDTNSPQTLKMSTVAERLRRPIPAWHPTFIAHIVRYGQWSLAASLITRLLRKLTFWSEGEDLQSLLNIPAAQLYGAEDIQDAKTVDRETVLDLTEQLRSKDLPQISQSEQRRLICVLNAMLFCAEHVDGLDNLALRYLYSWKFELLLIEAKHPGHGMKSTGLSDDGCAAVPEMHWREVAFAFHSTSQQPLLDVLMAHYDNKITWYIARRLGLFAWLSDREALERIFESLAQTAYRSSSPPDPINASLYFLALHKKQTLLGLWRIATWHKEQRATMNFLRRDFAQPAEQTAAKKNAYALMGKRRFEYAAAFFLLAGDSASAVSVLAGQCGDIMLAIAVGRLYSGDDSSAIRRLLQDRLIPQAREYNDRWLLNWSYSLLSNKSAACAILLKPLEGVRNWQQDDPALLDLYSRLRIVDSEYEFDFILRAARILRRMGLWLIALELVSQWKFKHPKIGSVASAGVSAAATPNGVEAHATSMGDNFINTTTSHVDAKEEVDDTAGREAKAAELLAKIKAKKDQANSATPDPMRAQPTQFKEPDANSLLDSFGF